MRSLVSRPPYFERHEYKCRLTDAVRAAQVGGFRAGFELLEDPDDLPFAETGLAHVVSLYETNMILLMSGAGRWSPRNLSSHLVPGVGLE